MISFRIIIKLTDEKETTLKNIWIYIYHKFSQNTYKTYKTVLKNMKKPVGTPFYGKSIPDLLHVRQEHARVRT